MFGNGLYGGISNMLNNMRSQNPTDLYGLMTGGYNQFGDLGFAPMSQSNLGMMGITNPYAAAFRTPSYDKPIMPFGAAPMPAYGYQMQQGLLPQQQPTNTAPQQIDQQQLQKQLVDMGLLVQPQADHPFIRKLMERGVEPIYRPAYLQQQMDMYGSGSPGYGG